MDQDVQVLSQGDKGHGIRVYQLSPRPDLTWWRRFHDVASRRLNGLGVPAPALETGHGGDNFEIGGITEETSAATDQWMIEVVRETNLASRRPLAE